MPHRPTPLPGLPCTARPPKTGVWFAGPTTTPFSCGLHAFVPSLSEWPRSQHLGPPGIGPLAPERSDRQVKRSTGHAGINAQRANPSRSIVLLQRGCPFSLNIPRRTHVRCRGPPPPLPSLLQHPPGLLSTAVDFSRQPLLHVDNRWEGKSTRLQFLLPSVHERRLTIYASSRRASVCCSSTLARSTSSSCHHSTPP
jgi:hypothetical protein